VTKNWNLFPNEQPYGEDLANFSCYRLYEKSAIAGYGVLSGCVVSRSSASAVAVASGTFTVAGVKKTFAGGSLTSISAAAAGKHRYDLVYIDGADDTLKLAAGTEDTPTSATDFLENYVPRPAGPTDTDWIVLAVIRVTESGIENTNFGTNSYATGSVANMRLGTPFGVDDTTLQVVDGVISVKPSYVKADGATPLTGNWDAGAFKITASQLESDVAAGTAPLVVASDTVIPNLNASKLEGNTASAFAVAAKGVTNGDSHDHSGGDGAAIVAGATSFSTTARVLGRKTASGGAGEECTASEVLAMLGTEEQGDIIYYNGSVFTYLPHDYAGMDLQCGGHGANPSWGKSPWVQETNFTARPPSTSTITMTSDRTSVIKKGMGLKYTWNGTTYYGIVSAITSNLLTVAGAPLSTSYDVTALYWCPPERVIQVDFFVSGKFADAANTGLLASDMNTAFDWNLAKAYCVCIRHKVKTDDSGANQPRVTISIAGAVVGTDNSNAGQAVAETWTSTVVGINTTNYDINPDEAIEVVTDANGSNDDAENLTVSAVFVLE